MSLVARSLRPCHLSEFDRNRSSILVCPSQPRPKGAFPWLLKRPGDQVVSILKTDKENWLKNGSNSFQVSFIEMSIRRDGQSLLLQYYFISIFLPSNFFVSWEITCSIKDTNLLSSLFGTTFTRTIHTQPTYEMSPRFIPFTVFLLPAFAWVKLCPKPWHTLLEYWYLINYLYFVVLICREIAVRIVPYSPDHGLVLIGGKVAKDDPLKDHHLE